MRRVEMINNGSVSKGLAELNQHIRYEQNETRNGVTDEGHMLSEEDESRINEDSVNIIGSLQRSEVVIHRPQKQPQPPIVRWERFLHVRSLKVLLVENDDSTRHVVSALLRNCSYEVTAVENGVEAWKVLDDSTKRIDLILTEVVMPFMSGLGLLGKIMSHQTCKNIPVIMMSSHDSMGIVFKCLSKGAVDFLVKPIRKNELKNLWQHVWRKSHSSSGSESGIRTQKPAKMISADESDKSGSNDNEDDDQSINLNTRDGSDHGSGTQSSWTKKAVEVDSPQTVTEGGQSADDPPDSTCARVNYSFSRPEGLSNHEPVNATRKRQREDNDLGNTAIGKHLTIGITENINQSPEALNRMTLSNTRDTRAHKLPQMCSTKDDEVYEKGPAKQDIVTPSENLSNQPTVLMDFINNRFDFRMENSEFPIPNDESNLPANKDKDNYNTKEMPSLELSLKSLRDIEDDGTDINEQNIWKPSSISAFSRYNSASTANPAPTGNISSSSPLDNSSEATPNMVFNSDGTPPNQHSNGSSNNNDMGSTTNNAFTKPAAFNDGYAPKVTVNIGNPSSAFQAVQNGHISHNQSNLPTKADSLTPNTVTGQAKETHPRVQVHHSHHHHHHHHHHHVHKSAQHEKQSGHDDLTINNKTTASPQCGSSNVWRVPTNGNGSNSSMNGSGSGSNHGSNGQNGSSIPMYNEAVTVEGDTDIATNGGAGGTSGSGSRSGVDENYVARRMAALNKFRQKRKERCFEKKVRYHSRKRLAEQRPRVRGQFVRQTQENNCKETDS